MRPDDATRLLPVTGPPVPPALAVLAGSTAPPDAGRTPPTAYAVPVRPRILALLVAIAAAVATIAVWRGFVGTHLGQVVEEITYDGALYGRTRLWTLAEPLLDVVSVSFVVLGTIVAMGVALVRRRWSLAAQVAVVMVGSNVSTQLLKNYVFDRADLGTESWWGNSLPSGHTTVAASVSVALVLAVPRVARPVVALLGAAYTAATGISTLVGQWHRPSDVVAAVCVVLFWGALACVLTTRSALDPARPGVTGGNRYAPRGSGTGWTLTVLGLVAVVCGVVAGWALYQTASVVESAAEVTSRVELVAYLGGACAVVAATAMAFALLLALRQAVARATAGVSV
ncbi:PAP2 superfamily protein [Sanguibacter gelidistatuariae]|uniref:PAP2 superfamily protein n=1 Tax=Sanguibacter gelidistatuariae TaxID=1814289 RepID=A0A1G6HPE8_9MICO|nr:phosphatase PAP2 family protein [Sanguibacter gelidistatuariae]SDB95735.1 PAP2 superfamily protein [Sanguibacter gelidistatuariae]